VWAELGAARTIAHRRKKALSPAEEVAGSRSTPALEYYRGVQTGIATVKGSGRSGAP